MFLIILKWSDLCCLETEHVHKASLYGFTLFLCFTAITHTEYLFTSLIRHVRTGITITPADMFVK